MNIQITDTRKYESVRKVCNYGAKLVSEDRMDGHLSIVHTEDGKEWTSAKFGITANSDLENEYGFRFVSQETDTDNSKYYF